MCTFIIPCMVDSCLKYKKHQTILITLHVLKGEKHEIDSQGSRENATLFLRESFIFILAKH